MDQTIPLAAALLLEFIYETETGRRPPGCYEVIFANKQHTLKKSLTVMTLDEVIAAQAGWSKQHGSSAAGAAQFMKATLQDLVRELKLSGKQRLDGNLQDRLAYHLLKRRGYEAYAAGTLSRAEFGKRLAQEWASFPVLENCKGAHRELKRGQSYYAGDGLNKALAKPETVEKVLDEVKRLARAPAIPPVLDAVPAEPGKAPSPLWAWILRIFKKKVA